MENSTSGDPGSVDISGMEIDAIVVAVLFPMALSATAYGVQQTWHALTDSPEEKWRKRYMKSLIRLYRAI